MAIVVDTCSLVAMARYYLPLNENGALIGFFKNGIETGEIILLDTIQQEMLYTAQGLAIKAMPFLKEKQYITNTADIQPPSLKKFDNLMDNNFCVRLLKNDLSNEEYIAQKEEFLKTGDACIIRFCMRYTHEHHLPFDEFYVLTEETKSQNDNKLFKKLPLICEAIDVKTLSLADYLKRHGVKVERIAQ